MLKLFLLSVLLTCGAQVASAQKNIIISDSLNANAEMLKVKMGFSGPGKIPKFHFGDYTVVSSKQGWGSGSSQSDFLEMNTESNSSQKFSFALVDKENDTAKVNTATHISSKTSSPIQLGKHLTWGSDELYSSSSIFLASIKISADTNLNWYLVMKYEVSIKIAGKYEAFITDGTRKVLIYPVLFDNNGKSPFPALGYEFMENNKSYCALQYRGSGAFGQNDAIVWLDTRIDAKMKLVLSAAMVAILELRLSEQGQR